MTEEQYKRVIDKLVARVEKSSPKVQMQYVFRLAHQLTVRIRCVADETPNLGDIYLANEYLHHLTGWLCHQESSREDPFPVPTVIARAWDALNYARALGFQPDLENAASDLLITMQLIEEQTSK